MNEVWLPIAGFDRYEVSNMGRDVPDEVAA